MVDKIKALRLKEPFGLENIQVTEMDDPGEPGPGEVRVRIKASSLNYHDYSVAAGHMNTEDGRIPMSDGAGVVEAVGQGVEEFTVGDHVVSTFFPTWQTGPARVADFTNTPGDGIDGYAREVVVRPTNYFTHQPRNYSHAESATLTTAGLTAWRALVVDGGIKPGSTVLVLGSGGVSVFACQLAKSLGATVFATSSSNEKLERYKNLGADHLINYEEDPEWGKTVRKLTHGRGVDHVVEVGGPGTLPQSIDAVAIGGHIALIGVLTGSEGKVPTAKLMAKQARLEGLIVGSCEYQKDLVRALEANGVKPVVDKTFAFEELADAFRYEKDGKHFGKICLEF
ncbi:zinc-dependent alcohol dehydrogenase family protein [Pseudidiomarina terrestris]|uniref:zinc-dependent alcohol dehydrogenase family protein n=1 Tax=Pseudidiomarina terrestris TaxID=2820060 RepID=UPI00264B29B0|nr:NAD(P)-dependent alcohol dehydrogenase [Pseudidiomarina sp. 1ASP75-5]MDN7135516.1 NAD(P)-dependent alcohol dehydrogenase [Pseudidiomarina sp. 1ASP75-5]